MIAHNSPDNHTGFAKVNDLYKAAMDDIEVMLIMTFEYYRIVENFGKVFNLAIWQIFKGHQV